MREKEDFDKMAARNNPEQIFMSEGELFMSEEQQHSWRDNLWIRCVGLLLFPAVFLGLYLISTRIVVNRPATSPQVTPTDPSGQ